MIELTFNGQITRIPQPENLAGALSTLGANGKFAVVLNGQFVPKSCYHQQPIKAGDQLDTLAPVAGG